jgi:hypothetical protein
LVPKLCTFGSLHSSFQGIPVKSSLLRVLPYTQNLYEPMKFNKLFQQSSLPKASPYT